MMIRHEIQTHEPFVFESGESLDALTLVYYTSDRPYTKDEKVVWICHALTGNANPEDWWGQMVGPGMLFDPAKYYVVCVNMLCSPYGSSSPRSINPKTGEPYYLTFPKTTTRDIVNAEIIIRKMLGIEKIDIMLGPSIGGFQTLEWVIIEPDVIERAVFLATSARAAPYLTAFNESQRMALKADPTFFEAKSLDGGREGLKCARSIALISYRTFDGYNLTQRELETDTMFADRAASYQRHQGDKLVNRGFDAYCYWYLTYALDSQNIGRGRGGLAKALELIKSKCTVISITSDYLFPPKHGKETASMLRHADYFEIESIFGHDGFLVENEQLTRILKTIV